MGCVCCSLGSFFSILLDALERVSLCTVCAMLTCCLLFTILSVMIMGVGIGFHYCFVQNSVNAMAKAAKAAGALRTGEGDTRGHVMRSVDKAMMRGFAHRLGRREAAAPPLDNNSNNNNFTDTNFTNYNFTALQNLTDYHIITLPNMVPNSTTYLDVIHNLLNNSFLNFTSF